MSSNTIIHELDKIFKGERDTALTSNEIDLLIADEITTITFFYIFEGLQKSAIPKKFYVRSVIDKIMNTRSKCYSTDEKYELALFGLAFRGLERANPNEYIRMKGVGVIHIIGYIYKLFNKRTCLFESGKYITILMMLMYLGSNINLPIFSDDGAYYKNTNTVIDINLSTTVRTYLLEGGQCSLLSKIEDLQTEIKTFIKTGESKNILVDALNITRLGLYLDLPELILPNRIESLIDVIKYQDIRIIKENKLGLLSKDIQQNVIRYSAMFNSPDIFYMMYQRTGDISYVNMNILLAEAYKLGKFTYLQERLKENIIMLIQDGVTLDVYQVEMLRKISNEFVDEIINIYNQPRQKKECSIEEGEPTHELRLLAYELNIDPLSTKNFICKSIKEIADADPTKIKEAALKRQMAKIRSESSKITDYIEGDPESKFFKDNRIYRVEDVIGLVDFDYINYKDEQGITWYFTKDQFDELLAKKYNIHLVGQKLSEEFLERLKDRKKFLERLGVYEIRNKKIDDGIKDLNSNDQVRTKDDVQRMIDRFEKLLEKEKILPQYLRNLSPPKMTRISLELGEDQINYAVFNDITGQRYAVFALTMLSKFDEDPNNIRKFAREFVKIV